VNENSESSAQEETNPTLRGDNPVQPEPERAPTRQRSRTARVVADAVTSRTAGWMVAAALAGALTTLALEPSTSTPAAAKLIPVRNAASAHGAPRTGRIHAPVRQQIKWPAGVYGKPGAMLPPGAPCTTVLPGGPYPGPGRMIHIHGAHGIRAPKRELFIRPGRHRRFSISLALPPRCLFVPPGRCAVGAIGQVPAKRFTIVGPGGRAGQSGAPRPSRRFIRIPDGGPIDWQPMIPGCVFMRPQGVSPGQ